MGLSLWQEAREKLSKYLEKRHFFLKYLDSNDQSSEERDYCQAFRNSYDDKTC